jgi:hypothetical protein
MHINYENIEETLLKIGKNLAVTRGECNYPPTSSVDDLDWNHMDWDHRPIIHKTYINSIRIYANENAAISLTEMRFFGLRFFIQVSDSKLGKGFFYQSYTVFGLIFIHGVLRNTSENTCFNWYIVSSKWLKPLHNYLSKKLFNLNIEQMEEDQVIRKRRAILRKEGYSFGESERNFITSNDKLLRTEYPEIRKKYIFDVSTFSISAMHELDAEGKIFLVRKNINQQLELWPKVCPHEGGELNKKDLCQNGDMICPWHEFRINPIKISQQKTQAYGATFSYSEAEQKLYINS